MQPPNHRDSPNGLTAARAAFLVGLPNAAVSIYWVLGGTWLVDTVGGFWDEQGRAGNPAIILAVWAASALKITAAVLPLLALRGQPWPAWNRIMWVLACVESRRLSPIPASGSAPYRIVPRCSGQRRTAHRATMRPG